MKGHDLSRVSLDISYELHEFRKWLLENTMRHIPSWDVLHLVIPGPTLPHNYGVNGYGPWARIHGFSKPVKIEYPSGYVHNNKLPKEVHYLIAIYLPRAVTTSKLSEVILHEYLHIGFKPGSLISHPPRQEKDFCEKSRIWDQEICKMFGYNQFVSINNTWVFMQSLGTNGLTCQMLTRNNADSGLSILPEQIDISKWE